MGNAALRTETTSALSLISTLPMAATGRDPPQTLLVCRCPAPMTAIALIEGASGMRGGDKVESAMLTNAANHFANNMKGTPLGSL